MKKQDKQRTFSVILWRVLVNYRCSGDAKMHLLFHKRHNFRNKKKLSRKQHVFRPVGSEFFHADRKTDTTTLIVASSNVVNPPKNDKLFFSSRFLLAVIIFPYFNDFLSSFRHTHNLTF